MLMTNIMKKSKSKGPYIPRLGFKFHTKPSPQRFNILIRCATVKSELTFFRKHVEIILY